MSEDTDIKNEVEQFRDESEYAQEEYPGEKTLHIPPHDKFRLVERNETLYAPIQDQKYWVKMELAREDEIPESEWAFWAKDEGLETPREVEYECRACGNAKMATLHTPYNPEEIEVPCQECHEGVIYELADSEGD